MFLKLDGAALAVKDASTTKSTTAIDTKLVGYDDHIVNLTLLLKNLPH